MMALLRHSVLAVTLVTLLQLAVIARILLRQHREPASRIAWVAVVASLPLIGMLAYLFLGEVSIGRRRTAHLRKVRARMPTPPPSNSAATADGQGPGIATPYRHLFDLGHSISGFAPVAGNAARLLADANATIDSMVVDIDAAVEHVHVLFYIWLPDHNGSKIADALRRAAGRGVTCRAMADAIGSRSLIRSPHWAAMQSAGVRLAASLPTVNPLLRPLAGRVDLRDHRKILVVDGRITYCGSQNCADPEFLVKAKFGPWVDAVIRFEGPIAQQNQFLFARDWMTAVDEDLSPLLLARPPAPLANGFSAQVIGTGPTVRFSAMVEMFASLCFAARRELVVTTPYYVPNDALQSALCTTAYRGVATTIVLPARNDSWVVAAASRSYYADLLAAGVTIYEYQGGLLHTKSLTIDDEITLIGSANMDRRSFDLNYENNILFQDASLTRSVRERQRGYIAKSVQVSEAEVAAWSTARRLWNNAVATLGPIL